MTFEGRVRFEGHGLTLSGYDDERSIYLCEGDAGQSVVLDRDGLRWLCFVAGPAFLAAPESPAASPSEPPEKVEGQIEGQTTIDDVLKAAG